MTIRLDKFVHRSPRFYKQKINLIYKIKCFIYESLGINKKYDEIAENHSNKQDKIYRTFFSNNKILDIACGRGDFMDYMKTKYSCNCIGLDISKNMILFASKKFSNHEYLIGNSNNIPFADNSIDVVVLNNLIHHLPIEMQKKTIRESIRIAKRIVMINDTVNWENWFKRCLANVFWKLIDGGYIYRTEKQWNELLENEKILDYNIGAYFMRRSYFIIDANSSKKLMFAKD